MNVLLDRQSLRKALSRNCQICCCLGDRNRWLFQPCEAPTFLDVFPFHLCLKSAQYVWMSSLFFEYLAKSNREWPIFANSLALSSFPLSYSLGRHRICLSDHRRNKFTYDVIKSPQISSIQNPQYVCSCHLLPAHWVSVMAGPYSWYQLWLLVRVRTGASQVVPRVKNLPTNAEDVRNVVQSPGQEDPLEEGMATHSSTLAWRIPWTEEPGGLQSMGSQRAGHDWSDLARGHAQGEDCWLCGYVCVWERDRETEKRNEDLKNQVSFSYSRKK